MRYILVSALAGLVLIPVSAEASDRYGQKPPLGVSTTLTSPWTAQLQQQPVVATMPKRTMSTAFQRSILQNRRNTEAVQKHLQEQEILRQAQLQRNQALAEAAARKRQQQKLANIARSTPKKVSKKSSTPSQFLPQIVNYRSSHRPGTIVIDTQSKFLYLVLGNGEAKRYGVGVGKAGFEWTGTEKITRKKEWPSWTPPKEMIAREAKKGRNLPAFMPGGPENPLGARALYLGSTLYRIHGTNAPWTIGQAMSSGCIRMRNEDVSDLYERAKIGATVHVI